MLLALSISGLGLYAAGIVGILLMGVWSLTAMIIYKIHKVPALPEFYRNLESYHLSDGPPGVVWEMSHINVEIINYAYH